MNKTLIIGRIMQLVGICIMIFSLAWMFIGLFTCDVKADDTNPYELYDVKNKTTAIFILSENGDSFSVPIEDFKEVSIFDKHTNCPGRNKEAIEESRKAGLLYFTCLAQVKKSTCWRVSISIYDYGHVQEDLPAGQHCYNGYMLLTTTDEKEKLYFLKSTVLED